MRTYLKKISALLLALVMVMGMCVTAGAAYSATVTIENDSDEAADTLYYYLQIIEPDTSSSLGWKFVDYTFSGTTTIADVVMSALGVSSEEEALKALIGDADDSEDIKAAIEAVAAVATLNDMTQLTAAAGTLSIDDTTGTATITLSDAGLYYIKAVASGVAYTPMAVYVQYEYDASITFCI